MTIGNETISFSFMGKTLTKSTTIKNWSNFTVSSNYISLAKKENFKMKSNILFADGTFLETTNYMTLQSNNSNVLLTDNVIKGNFNGTSEVTIQFANVSQKTKVYVSNKELVSINIIGVNILNSKSQEQFQVQAVFSDSSTKDITNHVDWIYQDDNLLEISETGKITALLSGNSIIEAVMGDTSKEKNVSIIDNSLLSINLEPINVIANGYDIVNYKAIGNYTDGSSSDITKFTNWTIANNALGFFNENILSLNAVVNYAQSVISATSNLISTSGIVSINNGNISSIYIPHTPVLIVGENYKLTAYAIYDNNSVVDISEQVVWNSSNYNIIGVSNNKESKGNISAQATGNVTITASFKGISSTVSVNSTYARSLYSSDKGLGLRGYYYSGINFNSFVASRIDKNVNYNWSYASKAAIGLTEAYSVRWSGKIKSPYTGTMFLCTDSDDGVRLKFNNLLVINNWTQHSVMRNCSTALNVVQGQKYDIELDFFENTGSAVIQLYWGDSTGNQVIIPQESLYPN